MVRNMDAFHLKKLLDQLKEIQPPTDKALRTQQEHLMSVSIGRDLLKSQCTLEDVTGILKKLKRQFQNSINNGDNAEMREEFTGYVSALDNALLALRSKKEIPEYPESRDEHFICGYCEQAVAYRQKYCSKCGQRFEWDGVQDLSADVQS